MMRRKRIKPVSERQAQCMPSIAALTVTAIVLAAASACGGSPAVKGHRRAARSFGTVATADGKIVAVGRAGLFAVTRYTNRGRLDASFGTGGKVVTDVGSKPGAGYLAAGTRAVAVQRDHKIVALGWTSVVPPDPAGCNGGGNGHFALARYLPDGRLDRGFGTGGKVVDFGSNGADAGAVQADGKVVALRSNACDAGFVAALARYTSSGRLDHRFGTEGRVEITSFRPSHDVIIDPDRKIIVAGSTFSPDASPNLALARYLPDGRLDASFGSRGKVVAHFEGGSRAEGIALQADGKLVAVGWIHYQFALARYTDDGRLDSSFGGGGKVVTDLGPKGGFSDSAGEVAVQADGKIIAAGAHEGPLGRRVFFTLARYTSSGHLDPSFGAGGKVVNKSLGAAFGLAIQSDGEVVVPAVRSSSSNAPFGSVLVRYTTDGRLDESFGKSARH